MIRIEPRYAAQIEQVISDYFSKLDSFIKPAPRPFNTYDIEATPCPECDAPELVFIQNCSAIHCQNCGVWFDPSGAQLDPEAS